MNERAADFRRSWRRGVLLRTRSGLPENQQAGVRKMESPFDSWPVVTSTATFERSSVSAETRARESHSRRRVRSSSPRGRAVAATKNDGLAAVARVP
jgi:hypothetical protein